MFICLCLHQICTQLTVIFRITKISLSGHSQNLSDVGDLCKILQECVAETERGVGQNSFSLEKFQNDEMFRRDVANE